MERWRPPDGTSWGDALQRVCFNDDCPYYAEGWAWMEAHYRVHASYRHRQDTVTGQSGPLPVWSPSALRDRIVKET